MELLDLPKAALRVPLRLLRIPITTYELVADGARGPRTRDEVARKGLVGGALGAVKEVLGSFVGDDRLATAGRLQQAKAVQEREAAIEQVIAETKRQRAPTTLAEGQREHDQERAEVAAKTAAEKSRSQRAKAKRAGAAATSVEVALERAEALQRARVRT